MLKELMKKEQFDLVHCHMPLTGVLARMAAKKTKTATVIYTGHGFHFYSGASVKHWIFYPIERFMARYTDGLITINEEDYQRAKVSCPWQGILIHGVGIDCEQLLKAEQNGSRQQTEQSSGKKSNVADRRRTRTERIIKWFLMHLQSFLIRTSVIISVAKDSAWKHYGKEYGS